jgi:Sulfotransferase domain
MHDLQSALDITDATAVPEKIHCLIPQLSPARESIAAAVSKQPELPSFFIVGPPRTGSSWLYKVLAPHTLLPSPAKETRFFDNHFCRGFKWYMAHYPGRNGNQQLIGEVAPTYFASVRARERLAGAVPRARIVCVFRNPVERIVSLYRLKRAYGLIPWNLEQAIERDQELLETSRYGMNLVLWRRAFGAQNVMAAVYDDLGQEPQAFIDAVLDFIGVPRFVLAAEDLVSTHASEKMTHPRNYYRTRSATLAADWFKARRMDHVVSAFRRSPLLKFVLGGGRPFQPLSPEFLRKLYERFRPEVEELEVLLGRDLSHWKAPPASA